MIHSINVGIIGATGHTGEELIAVLLRHPYARMTGLYNTAAQKVLISEAFPRFKGRIDLSCGRVDFKEIEQQCDLVFLALPHTVSMQYAARLIDMHKRVVDLSADYRLKNRKTYERYYGKKHTDPNLARGVYGLPEIRRALIQSAQLVANPGCYPTAAILGLAPLCALGDVEPRHIVINAASGVSGAGKKMVSAFHFTEAHEDFRAYKIDQHQHAPEIEQELSLIAGKKVSVTFVPHLLPINRGILCTMYVPKGRKRKGHGCSVHVLYKNFYKKEPFIRVKDKGMFPRIKDVVHTNFCDIGLAENAEYYIVITAIDNLAKGAAHQAVQNMNVMYRFPETAGLV